MLRKRRLPRSSSALAFVVATTAVAWTGAATSAATPPMTSPAVTRAPLESVGPADNVVTVVTLPALQPGDRLRVVFPGTPIDGREVMVNAEGTITLAELGDVTVAGLSLPEARAALVSASSRSFRHSEVLELTWVARGTLVDVGGWVEKPGALVLDQDPTIWRALMAAGGPRKGADLTRVTLIRNQRHTSVDVEMALAEGTLANLPGLQAGDTLTVPLAHGTSAFATNGFAPHGFVPTKSALAQTLVVTGAVQSPGRYPRTPTLDVLSALMLAGGPTADASLSAVQVQVGDTRRTVDVAAAMIDSSARRKERLALGDGAVTLFIPSAISVADQRLTPSIQVLGGVTKPGRIAIAGRVTLEDALALAGGPTQDGDLEAVTIVRRHAQVTVTETHDLLNALEQARAPVYVERGDTVLVARTSERPMQILLASLSSVAVIASLVSVFVGLIPGL